MATIPTSQTNLSQFFLNRNGRAWSNYSLDLSAGNVYSIDNTPILSSTTLGVTVTASNLRQVGTLNNLDVAGDAIFGNFAYFNSEFNRLGLGTNEPRLALDIVENNVNLAFGSPDINLASLGTLSNHNLAIVTDSQARITISNTGQIDIGDSINQNAVVNIHGELHVSKIVTDTRIDRSSSLQFTSTGDSTVYGLGLVWNGKNSIKQFMLKPNPDRIWSNTSLELAANNGFFIDSQPVLNSTSLGPLVIYSNLVTVGTLHNLSVAGFTELHDALTVNDTINSHGLTIGRGADSLALTSNSITSGSGISISNLGANVISFLNNGITIGDSENTRRTIKLYGSISLNTNSPDPSIDLTIPGDVSFGGQRQTHGADAPTTGLFSKGDICWNTEPLPNSYVGWICIADGTPGQWRAFGLIAD